MIKNQQHYGRIVLITASVIWGTTFAAISATGTFFPPSYLLMLRCIIGCVILALLFRKRLKNLTCRYFLVGSGIGFLMTGGYLLQTIALVTVHSPPGRCAFLVSTYCILTPFATWFIEKRKPSRYNIFAAIICTAGVLLISLPALIHEKNSTLDTGDMLALLSSMFFAIYLVYVSRYMKKFDPLLLTIVHLIFAAVYCGIYSILFEDMHKIVWTIPSIAALLYLSVICTALTCVMQAIGQRLLPASTAALIFSLESVFGIMFSVIFMNEKLSLILVAGCTLIFIAILISETQLIFLRKYFTQRRNVIHSMQNNR